MMEVMEAAGRTLNLERPWVVARTELIDEEQIVEIYVEFDNRFGPCPEYGKACIGHDTIERHWRHLDLLECQSWIVCKVSRVRCDDHNVKSKTWAQKAMFHLGGLDLYPAATIPHQCQ